MMMFYGASNVQLGGKLLKIYNPKLKGMCLVEHTVSLIFNDISKIITVNYMITEHREIYNIFGSGIYHKNHSIFQPK